MGSGEGSKKILPCDAMLARYML